MFLCSSKPLARGSLCHRGNFTTPGIRHDPDKSSAWFYWYAQDLKCTYVCIEYIVIHVFQTFRSQKFEAVDSLWTKVS